MFISTCFRANSSISKGEFLRVVSKSDFLSFSPHLYPSFSHAYLSYPLLYQSSRDLCSESVLGDQSVEITKVFHLVFEEVNLRVRVISSSCGSSV